MASSVLANDIETPVAVATWWVWWFQEWQESS